MSSMNNNNNTTTSRSTAFRRASSARKNTQKSSALSSLLRDSQEKELQQQQQQQDLSTPSRTIHEDPNANASPSSKKFQSGGIGGKGAPLSTNSKTISTSNSNSNSNSNTATGGNSDNQSKYEAVILNSNGEPIDNNQPHTSNNNNTKNSHLHSNDKNISNTNAPKTNNYDTDEDDDDDDVMVSAFSYRGLELIITCHNSNKNNHHTDYNDDDDEEEKDFAESDHYYSTNQKSCIQLITARSRMILQTLIINDEDPDNDNNNKNDNETNKNKYDEDYYHENKDTSSLIINTKGSEEFEVQKLNVDASEENVQSRHYGLKGQKQMQNQSLSTAATARKKKHIPVRVVTMKTNPTSGCISVITSNCKCITFYPIPTPPSSSSKFFHNKNNNRNNYVNQHTNLENISTAFGKFNWIRGHVIDLKKTFSNMNKYDTLVRKCPLTTTAHPFKAASTTTASPMASLSPSSSTMPMSSSHVDPNIVHLGLSSMDYKLLIAHGDQIAVYSIVPPYKPTLPITPTITIPSSTTVTSKTSQLTTALLQWTTRVRATITNCDISGDGRAIVYTLDKEGVGVPYPTGVRTFVRDLDDGSDDHLRTTATTTTTTNSATTSDRDSILNASGHEYKLPPKISKSRSGNDSDLKKVMTETPERGSFRLGGITPPPIPRDQVYGLSPTSSGSTPHTTTTPTTSPIPVAPATAGTPRADNVYNTYPSNLGILYKPGPFLVHSNPVTRLSFRGQGLNFSSISSDYERKRKKMRKKQRQKSSEQGTASGKSSSRSSSVDNEVFVEGNDLLLTNCSSDGSMRVFFQGTWKMLLHWDTPPGSRADWIQGITMANLGDLDPFPKSTKRKKSVSGGNNGTSLDPSQGNGNNNGGVNRQLLKTMSVRNGSNSTQVQTIPTSTTATSSGGWNTHQSPQSAAGAWISELTFRGPFPALRLSRLSFLKSGGGDAWAPAHFESVAAILPPATILPKSVLGQFCGDEGNGMIVQGIWPAWNRWVAHPNAQSGVVEDDTLSGNAMSLIGAMPQGMTNVSGVGLGSGTNMGTFGGTGGMSMASFGGSHAPPSELRLVSSHPHGNKVIVLEFPLWGDTDFGAMELGSPLRYLLSLNEEVPKDAMVSYRRNKDKPYTHSDPSYINRMNLSETTFQEEQRHSENPTRAPLPVTTSTRCACLDYESNNLCAVVSDDRRNVKLIWRKKGTMNIIQNPSTPYGNHAPRRRTFSNGSVASTVSLDSTESHSSYRSENLGNVIDQFSDISLVPVPLSLPSLHLPVTAKENECFSLLKWWPDENFGGPPRLFALTNLGTLILYEMPPPWSALEPIMPMDDPFAVDAMGSIVDMNENSVVSERNSDEEGVIYENNMLQSEEEVVLEYEVQVTPHTDFGLGLRLEAQADGMPAIAGSYKKHPLTGGRLPAEKTGKIVLGDELVSVNGVTLEGMTFDDIISTVRLIGSKSQGGALNMKFRTVQKNRFLRETLSHLSSEKIGDEEGLEVIHQGNTNEGNQIKSSASVMVGADAEMQQGFGRIVAIIANALPSFTDTFNHSPRSLLLLPWNYGIGAPIPYQVHGAVILVSAVGRTITTSRLEILNGIDPESCSILDPLGTVDIDSRGSNISPIKSLEIIKNSGDGWCIAACDESGDINMIFIDITRMNIEGNSDEEKLVASFRTNFICNCCLVDSNLDSQTKDFLVRAPSMELLGTMPVGGLNYSVNVWTSSPYVCCYKDGKEKSENEEISGESYTCSKIYHRGDPTCRDCILDFRWVRSGHMDSYPWLLTFSTSSVIIHRRAGWSDNWIAIAEVAYPQQRQSNGLGITTSISYQCSLSPVDTYPHLVAALRTMVTANDERNYIKSDWNPESILAVIISDPDGIETSIKRHVGGLFKWLSKWLDPEDTTTLFWDSKSALLSAPFEQIYNPNYNNENEEHQVESAAALMTQFSLNKQTTPEEDSFISQLQGCLKTQIDADKENRREQDPNRQKFSREFNAVMQQMNTSQKKDDERILPEPLNTMQNNELSLLWSIGELYTRPPHFKDLDESSRLTLFSISLNRQIRSLISTEDKSDSLNNFPAQSQNRTFLVKKSSSLKDMSKKAQKLCDIASSTVLSALASNTQNRLLKACRKSNERLDWDSARFMNISLWLRSDEELKKISLEIGQSTYKSTMDVLEAAVFFVAIGNLKMLKTIAATDRNHSGKTFFKFITDHDFKSTRGRTAAEKNAYSLLRKRRYRPAVAFFLLAQPPMLKSALDVIVTKMEDYALAFFVARLVESNLLTMQNNDSNNDLIIGGMKSLHGFGGGGGFATVGVPSNFEPVIESKFDDWKPNLGIHCKQLVEKHGFTVKSTDEFFRAIQLLWLGRRNDAAMFILGQDMAQEETGTFTSHKSIPKSVCVNSSDSSFLVNALVEANMITDFASRPHILQQLKVPKHALSFSTLQNANALCHRGLELSAIMTLTRPGGICAEEANKNNSKDISEEKEEVLSSSTGPLQTKPVVSSIFDSFEAPQPSSQKHSSQSQGMTSSIFDSFDTPKPSLQKQAPGSQEVTSSIFDSFDAPKPARQKKLQTSQSETTSFSIFDSFGIPGFNEPKKSTPSAADASGAMNSSIFDSFDKSPNGAMHRKSEEKEGAVVSSDTHDVDKVDCVDSSIADITIPHVWFEWKRNILTATIARRLIREISRITTPFLKETAPIPIKLFRRHVQPLIPYSASRVFQEDCDGEMVLSAIVECLDQLCSAFDVSKASVVEQALILIASPDHAQNIVYSVILHCLTARADLVEDVLRHAAHDQVQRCESFIEGNNDLVHNRKTKHYISSHYMRRQASTVSYQLELCLWLHRGGAFPLSGLALKETTVGVRIGLIVAAWGRCYECLENIIKCEPDCPMDFDRGRQLWSSMKMILSFSPKEDKNKVGETTSGGWEFLVDCNREEATDLLRNRKCGSFLLRPHPDDHGVFTLSFRTNLKPNKSQPMQGTSSEGDSKILKRDDVVQHAVVRLSDAGFKCGSFGPFSSLLKLLESVSASLPFDLLFSEPPAQGIIKEEGGQPSPNAVFMRKLALNSRTDHYKWNGSTRFHDEDDSTDRQFNSDNVSNAILGDTLSESFGIGNGIISSHMGMFSQLLVLTELRKQLCAVVAADDEAFDLRSHWNSSKTSEGKEAMSFDGSVLDSFDDVGEEEMDAIATRTIRPFLSWCRALETEIVDQILPRPETANLPVQEDMFKRYHNFGDGIIRRMIQPKSGVEFRTLRVGEAGHSAVIVLFRKSEALSWIVSSGAEMNEEDAIKRLDLMQRRRVIEQVDLEHFAPDKQVVGTNDEGENESDEGDKEIRFRFVDPWEVEVIESKEAELRPASLGRHRYVPFTIGAISHACQSTQHKLGGQHLLSLWSAMKGGVCVTKAFAGVLPPWERDAGGDLHVVNDLVTQPTAYDNSFRQHLYRNALYRRLNLPQRFIALVQVEMLDLKNLTSPGGSPSLTAYALLRLKRDASNAPLTHKARTLDSASTEPRKISKSSGLHAPASWGSVIRFRFPLPEGVTSEGVSFDKDREALFKGAPSVLQLSVYEKKFMSDIALGGADVRFDGLSTDSQVEEWVPLRSTNDEITWFVRIRLMLRFELMCIDGETSSLENDKQDSAGLKKIRLLSRIGGAHEDTKGVSGVHKSLSSPDMMSTLKSMV